MAAPHQEQWRDVQDVLSGQPTQQVLFANYEVHIGDVHGGVLNFAGPGQQAADRVRPHHPPPRILPRQVAGFLDREQEQRLVGQALARRQVVDLHGPDGVGKTALVGETMRTQLPAAFPDGMVYLSARHQAREDLLQDLFESFFETGEQVKATENDVRRELAGKRALIAIDDANALDEGDAEALAQAVPDCAMLITGREQQVWQGAGIALHGLPEDEAVALFEQHWGQVPAQDRPIVQAICQALQGVPLAIVKTARSGAERRASLADVLRQVRPRTQAPNPVGQAFWAAAGQLSTQDQRLLAGVAAPEGETVGVEALPAITGLSPEEIARRLPRLQQLDQAHAHSPRYSVDEGFRPYIRGAWVDQAMRERTAEYYLHQADRLQGPGRHPDEENVVGALRYYYRRGQWQQVIAIVRVVERYLAATGRWGQWRKRLHNAWRAARELGDRATEGWVQNQLGIIAVAVGDVPAAVKLFNGALRIWSALGDRAGVTISRWNLQLLVGPPPPPPRRGERPARPSGGPSSLAIVLAGSAALLTVVLGILVYIVFFGPPATPEPPTVPSFLQGTTIPTLPLPITPETPTSPCDCGDGICESEPPCNESPRTCPADCRLPDLVVAALEAGASASIDVEGNIEAPVRVIVRNQGGTPAGVFKVSLEVTGASGTYGAAFTVAGQGDIWYPYTEAPLAAGSEVAFEGRATFPSTLQGQTVSLTALADSCAGEEFAAPTCRVEESNEDNNRSAPVSVALPSTPPQDLSGPIVGEPVVSPELPGVDQIISIVVPITDDPSGVNRAELWYWYVPGEFAWVRVPMDRVDDMTFSANIGPFPEGGDVQYRFRAWDNAVPENLTETDTFKLTIVQID